MESQKERFAELDLLRFLAALSVVVYHYKTLYVATLGDRPELAKAIYAVTKFGYLGVDLFFIISGFVIFASALGRTPFQFAVSRATRIYPTLWVCVTITTLVVLALPDAQKAPTLREWAANLTLLPTYLGIPWIDGVYWTLLVEIHFYACVFLLLLTGLFRHYRAWIALWLAAAVLFAFARQPFFMGWIISPEYSSNFIAGIVFFLARRDGWRPFHAVIALVSLGLTSYYAHGLIDTFARGVTAADRWTAVAIVIAFHFVFFLISIRRLTLHGGLAMLSLGGITYPLYLLHNRAGKAIFEHLAGGMSPLLLVTLLALGMIFASWVIHVYLERRIADRLKAWLISLGMRFGRSGRPAPDRLSA